MFFYLEIYDARSADVWSLGIILYTMTFGFSPYNFQNEMDVGYKSIVDGTLIELLHQHRLLRFIKPSVLELIIGCLQIEEKNRLTTTQILKHYCLKSYYVKYKSRIEKEKKNQDKKKNSLIIKDFPYYSELNLFQK